MGKAKQRRPEQDTLLKNSKRYRGSILMTVDDEVYVTKNAKRVHKIIRDIEKKHHKRPLITVIPQGDTLILITRA